MNRFQHAESFGISTKRQAIALTITPKRRPKVAQKPAGPINKKIAERLNRRISVYKATVASKDEREFTCPGSVNPHKKA